MRPPVVAVGDGALGFWAAVRDVWPKTREQRDCVHKLANILDTLPRRLQPRAKAALHEVMYAETGPHAREAITRFATEYGAKYPKAVTTLEKDIDTLLTFFDFPAEHWKHLRTSNVIESPSATVRLRQRVTKGADSRTKGLLMAYKLLDMTQARWRRLDGAHLLPLVRAGITFVDGAQQTTRRRSGAGQRMSERDAWATLPPVELIAGLPLEELPGTLTHLAALQVAVAARLAMPGATCRRAPDEKGSDHLLTIRDAASRAGTSVDWFHRHARSLPFSRRIGRKRLFSEQGLMRWLATRGA